MNKLLRRPLLRLAALWAFGAVAPLACNSNFIPVPPPGDPTFEALTVADAMGTPRQVWQVSGPTSEAMKNSRVFIFNTTLGLGVIVKATESGTYSSGLFEGAVGDKVELSYESPTAEKSPSICRRLQVGVAQTACE